MGNATHSPGPWRANNGVRDGLLWSVDDAKGEEVIVACRGGDLMIRPADLALILASPAMLSALESILVARALHSHESYHPEWLESLMPQVRQAIAKATGGG